MSSSHKETDAVPRRPGRGLGLRIVGTVVMLLNLVLTVAVVLQLRDLKREVARFPADVASRRDVAALSPLGVRSILSRRCLSCHSSRALGATVSMEPAELPALLERMQSHPGANIPSDELTRIASALLVLRCARCHSDRDLGLMAIKSSPERMATIRDMAALPGSGIRIDQIPAIASAFDTLLERWDHEPGVTGPVPSTSPSSR